MVVHHTDRLHERVRDDGPKEGAAPASQVAAERGGFRGAGGNVGRGLRAVVMRAAAHKPPEVGIEAAELPLQAEDDARVADGGFDLQPVADDPRVGEQAPDAIGPVGGYLLGVEAVERMAVGFAFAQNRQPAEAGLSALEHQKFEQAPVIVQRDPPLLVVVAHVQKVVSGPRASKRGHAASHQDRR